MGTTDKQYIGQFFGYLPLIGKKLPKYSLEETLVLKRLSIIYICLCNGKIQSPPAVFDGNMQLEAIEPSIVDFPTSAIPLNTLLRLIRLLLHAPIGVESTKDMPEH